MNSVIPLPRHRAPSDGPTGVLHDVRGSLNVIRGQCHAIVRAGRVGDRTIEMLRLVDGEVDRIARALEQVRSALQGCPAGGTAACDVDAATVVHEAVRRHEGLAGERGVAITAIVGGRPRWVSGDEDELRRMVDNLLQNAIRACSHNGHVMVRMGMTGSRVVIRIVDDGRGWKDADELSGGDGWGMGVQIARGIAERHGGSVTHAGYARGTSVTIALPAREPERVGA